MWQCGYTRKIKITKLRQHKYLPLTIKQVTLDRNSTLFREKYSVPIKETERKISLNFFSKSSTGAIYPRYAFFITLNSSGQHNYPSNGNNCAI